MDSRATGDGYNEASNEQTNVMNGIKDMIKNIEAYTA